MLKYADIEGAQENSVIDMREEYTYGTETSIEDEAKIKDLIKSCQEMLNITKKIVFE